MAYVNAETTKNIRKALKEAFPSYKFSVKKRGSIALTVTVLESDLFAFGEQTPVNHYYIESNYRGEQCAFLLKVNELIKQVGGWWDDSDTQTDYFSTAFYYDIRIGEWNKPHKRIALK